MITDKLTLSNPYPYTKDTIRKINAITQYLTEDDFFEVEVSMAMANKYFGDFSGLLNTFNVPLILHPYTMAINNIMSSDAHITDIDKIKLIQQKKVKGLLDYTLT